MFNRTLLCLCYNRLMSEIDSSMNVARQKRDRNTEKKTFRCFHRPLNQLNVNGLHKYCYCEPQKIIQYSTTITFAIKIDDFC